MNPTLECALYYISQGWAVLPLYTIGNKGYCSCGKKKCSSPGKHPYSPLAPNGVKDATTNKDIIERWFGGEISLNIGISAGAESGLVLLDIDPKHGGDKSIKQYSIPDTVEVITGGGGRHYYFKHPGTNVEVRNSAGTLGPGIDVRGHHGYVAAPPSKHISGNPYKFAIDPRARKTAMCPSWIVNQHKGGAPKEIVSDSEPIIEGKRDNTLISYAGKLRHSLLSEDEIYAALSKINERRCKPPLPDKDIRRIAKSASKYKPEKKLTRNVISPAIISLDSVQKTEVQWLWPNRFPMGKISLLVGDPGVGKSYLTLCIAAIISNGWRWPIEGTEAPKGNVLILTCEDDIADTIKPRLEALGANCGRIMVMEGVSIKNYKGEEWITAFEIIDHVHVLEQVMVKYPETKLIIFDPITAYLGPKIDSHKNAEVRSALNPLTLFAHKYKVAILGINHLSKKSDLDTIYRTLGSIGFVGAPRAVWGVTFDKSEEHRSRRLLTPIKANLSVAPTTLGFKIVEGAILFEPEAMEMNSDRAFGNSKSDGNAEEDARVFLEEMLYGQEVRASVISKEARAVGISERTLARAKKSLNIKSHRLGDSWYWSLNFDEK